MELRHLRYFLAAAQKGSFTAAAKSLGVSQPTLTVALRELEGEVGATLFFRERTGVRPTPAGEELARHATDVFEILGRAEKRIHGIESDDVGRFVVGCHESLGAYFLPTFLKRFLAESPRIEVVIWNGTSAAVRDAVVAREVDFGLVVNPVPHPELVMTEAFRDAVDVFISSEGLPKKGLSLADAKARLREGPLVLAGRVQQCQEIVDRLAAVDALPMRTLSCGDLELVKSLALAGVGVALLPRRVAAYNVAPGALVRLHPDLPFIPDVIKLLYRADHYRSKAAQRLKAALLEAGRALP